MVTFDENGGDKPALPKQIVETYNTNYILPDTGPERTGYTFNG